MEKKDSKITGLLTLVVLALFALCILGTLLTGAKGYEALVRRGEDTYAARTAAQYLATRVRQSDAEGTLSLADFGGERALVLRQELEGEVYLTRIYCHGGYLRELFTVQSGSFSPEDGEKLLELDSLDFVQEGNTLSAHLVLADGQSQTLRWYLRSGEVQP